MKKILKNLLSEELTPVESDPSDIALAQKLKEPGAKTEAEKAEAAKKAEEDAAKKKAEEEASDPEKIMATKRKQSFLRPDIGMTPDKAFKNKETYISFLDIGKEITNKLLDDDGNLKPVFYIENETLMQDVPTWNASTKKYTAGTGAAVPNSEKYMKGRTFTNPFDSIEDAGGLKDNSNRKDKVVYYKGQGGVLEAIKYDTTGKALQIKAGTKLRYKTNPEWGIYTVRDVNAEEGTITIVGAKNYVKSGEEIKDYIDGNTPVQTTPVKESKNIKGKILKELNYLLNEAPNPNSGEGAAGKPAGAAPAAKTYTPAQRAQQKKIADDIRVKLGLPAAPAGVGLDKTLQDKINYLRSINPDFPKRSGDLTVGLANIQKWVNNPLNQRMIDTKIQPAAQPAQQPAAQPAPQPAEPTSEPANKEKPETQAESWSIRNKNKYAQNLFERLINDVPKKGKR